MAKKKKKIESLTDEQAFEAYLADQDKKKQEQANGQVRYREAAQASRIQYTNPTYTGKSTTGNYKWETNALRDFKMPKGMGKSYNDKFDYMTRQMGMTPGQAQDFRTYMDFNEDKSKDKYALKKYNFKKDENGNLIEINSDTPDEAWKLDRSSYSDGSGLHTKNEIIDGILSGMTSKAVQSFRNSQERQAKEVENEKKAAEKKSLQKTIAETNAVAKGFKTATSSNFPNNNVSTEDKNGSTWDGIKKGALKALEIVDRPGDAVRTGIKEKSEGNSFWQGAKEGFIGDKNTSGTELNKALGFDPKKDKVDRTLANVLGMVGTGALGTMVQSLNKDLANKMGDLTSGMATEVALDPLNLIGGGAVKGAKSLSLPRQVEELLKATGSTKYTDNAFETALKEAFAPKGDVSNVLAPKVEPPKPTPDEVFNQFVDETFKTKPPMKINNWQDKAYGKGDEQPVTNDVLWDAHTRRQAAEDDFVQQQLAPHYEAQQKGADAQTQWQTIVKQSKDEIDRILGTHGKISVPKGALEDYPVPPKFRASSKDKVSNDIYKFAEDEGFSSPEEAVRYLQQLDVDAKTRLKDLMPENHKPYTEKDWSDLESLARQKFAQSENGKAIDNLITDLLGGHNKTPKKSLDQALEELNTKFSGSKDTKKAEKDALKELESVFKNHTIEPKPLDVVTPKKPVQNSEIVNNSQGNKLTIDELNALVRGEQPTPKAEVETPKQESLLKLNAQRFNDGDAPDNSMFSYSKDTPDLVSDHMSLWQKGRESLVNSLQKFQTVSDNIIKRNADKIKTNYESRMEVAKQSGRPEEVKRLAKEYKYLHKDESELLKAAQNEQTSYMLTDELVQSTYGEAVKALDKAKISVADAWEYQAAKNLYYQMTKGGHTDYQLPKGWDIGRLSDVINRGDQVDEFKQFSSALNEIRETRLRYLTDYGLKSTEEFADLAKNPHYIPMMKDFDWSKSSLEASLKKQSSVGSAKPNVMALGKGDETFFDNPVESLVGATYTSIRNSLRNGTHGEFAKLAQLDKDGLFIRPTKEPAVYGGKVIEHYDNGVVQNYVLSDDLADVLHELRNPEQAAGVLEKVTGFMGSLKTTSIPYQMRAIPRDWTQAVVNMDGNPLSHIYNMMGMLKSPKKAMKEAMKEGGAFHNAFKDGMGAHRTTQEMAEQFVNTNRAKGGKDEIVKSENQAKKLFKNLWKLNLDYHVGERLGNFGDSAPRLAAMKQVEKEFMPAIQELEGKIASATDDFEKQTLTSELNDLKTKFQREKIFRARDVINYSRRGSSIGAKAFKRYWNFANTATQSVDRYFRQLHKKPVQTLLKTAAVAAPMMGAQEMWYRHSSDEDKKIYDDTPDFLRNTMYLFVVNGHRVMLPKPFEVALVTSPIEGVINSTHKFDEEDLKKKTMDGVVQGLREIVPLDIGDLVTFNFSAPSIVQPAVEVGFNRKNYNKKPISFYDMFEDGDNKTNPMIPSGKTAEDVASDYTSPTAVELANLSRMNPDYIQHLIGGYGGDTGKNVLAALDSLLQPSSEERKKVVTQNMNPLQDFFQSKKGDYLWRNAYTDKDKAKK